LRLVNLDKVYIKETILRGACIDIVDFRELDFDDVAIDVHQAVTILKHLGLRYNTFFPIYG
jgi:hypothetical protein